MLVLFRVPYIYYLLITVIVRAVDYCPYFTDIKLKAQVICPRSLKELVSGKAKILMRV